MMAVREGHTYLKTHRLSGKILQYELLDEMPELLERARTSRTGRTAKTLVKQGPFRITIVAMRKGAEMHKHHVDGPISVQVLRGRIELRTADAIADFGPGGLTTLEPAIEHSVTATSDAVFMITMSWHKV
jgi:quercetin dioxygenase-like cupin family protein